MNANEVKENFRYDSSSGKLFWKNRTKGKEAGCIKKDTGYIQIKFKGKFVYAHRLIMFFLVGDYDQTLQVDHIDHDRLNNKPDNLRLIAQRENLHNISKTSANTSGYVGVSYITRDKRYVAQIYIDRRNTNLGYFKTKEEAIVVRKSAEFLYGYHPNHGK